MSNFLKRAIRDGVCKDIGDAVGKAVQKTVEPHVTQFANKAAKHFDQAAGNMAQEARKTPSGLKGAFANLERAAIGFCIREPHAGFDYIKPEPKKLMALKDLFIF